MKKLLLVLVLLFATTALFAQADLSKLPSGTWLDPNYDASWNFSGSGIKLSTPTDGDIYTFTTRNIQDLKAVTSGTSAGVSFRCDATERTYTFLPSLDGTITMKIDRDGKATYEIKMKKQ